MKNESESAIAQRPQYSGNPPRRARAGKVSKMLKMALPYAFPILLFSVLVNLLRLTVPLYMLQVIDRVVSSESIETLVSISMVAFGALAASALLSNSSAQIQAQLGAWLDETLFGSVVLETLESDTPIEPLKSGGPVRELGQLRQFFSSPTISSLLEVPWSFVFIAILFYLHPYLGILACIAFFVLLSISILGEHITQSRIREGQQEKEASIQALVAAVQSSEAVKAMGMQARITRVLNRRNLEASAKLASASRGTTLVQNLTRFLRTLAQITVLGMGAYLVLENEATIGTMIAGSILLSLALSPVDKAVGSFKSLRIASRSVDLLNNQLSGATKPEDTATLPLDSGISISLRQAMYMPPSLRRPVLRPLSLEIAAGECIGVIGPVASGKTTLCRMLVGAIAPSNGSLRANDIEITRLTGEEFGRHVGYLGQGELPLYGTISDNISRFEPGDAVETEGAIAAAARLAGVSEAILGLPRRFRTIIGRSGVDELSPGQVQQILIARTFYKDPSFLVMDEPTSYLDKAAEAALIGAIEAAKKRKATIVLVTQRTNLLSKCDRLLYLHDGNLVTVGNREQILREISQGVVAPGPRRIGESDQRLSGRERRQS